MYAFDGCSNLKNVYINDISSWVLIKFSSLESNPLYYARNLYLNNELVQDLTIPEGVTSIGNYAFYGCSSLTNIEIPSSVKIIGDWVFRGCSSLISIEIPSSVKIIGDWAFSNCSSLTNIEIPSSVTSIGEYAFYGCSSLTNIEIPSSVTSIGSFAFENCSSLTIYCEVSSKPSGWYNNWNYSNCQVVWNYKNSGLN